MASRYSTTAVGLNTSGKYNKLFDERGVDFIKQFFTPQMRHLNVNEISTLNVVSHVWSLGDRYYKLAYHYYQDPSLWWVIAWYNRSPTEAHLNVGEVINIPLPIGKVLDYLGL